MSWITSTQNWKRHQRITQKAPEFKNTATVMKIIGGLHGTLKGEMKDILSLKHTQREELENSEMK